MIHFGYEEIAALLTLTALEIVLGIDNVIFISILAGKLQKDQRKKARQVGLAIAMLTRIALLLTVSAIMLLTKPLFQIFSVDFSGRSLILLFGGLFLLGKSTYEIHHNLEEVANGSEYSPKRPPSFTSAIIQIAILDIIFSLDSVITAIGMVDKIYIMVIAIVISVIVMLVFSDAISKFIEKHPTFKMLALSFLLLIGTMLIVEGCGKHVDRGYLYFAIGFSVLVESLNIRIRAKN